MASISLSQSWTGSSYEIVFTVSWNVKTESNVLNVYNYHGKANVLSVTVPPAYLIWNDMTTNTATISGFEPYMKYIATFANETYVFSARPHPNHQSDSYYPSFYPAMQTQIYQYDFTGFSMKGETGCCVANAVASAREKIEHDYRPSSTRKYSVSWIYGAINQGADEEGGMATDEVLDFLIYTGVPTYRKIKSSNGKKGTYPDIYIKQSKQVSAYGYTETMTGAVQRYRAISNSSYAQYGRISNWKRTYINDALEIMKYVSGYGKSACLDIIISEEFDIGVKNQNTQKGVLPRLNQYSSNRGAHCMVILGWKMINGEYHWICQNSWGRKYPFASGANWWDESTWQEVGDNGLIYVPFSYHKRITNNTIDGGVYNVYLIDGQDYGDDVFKWDTPKIKGQPFNITANEWTKLQNHINECLGYINKTPYTFTSAQPNQPFAWKYFSEVVKAITSSTYLGSSVSFGLSFTGLPIKADEHINRIIEALDSVT